MSFRLGLVAFVAAIGVFLAPWHEYVPVAWAKLSQRARPLALAASARWPQWADAGAWAPLGNHWQEAKAKFESLRQKVAASAPERLRPGLAALTGSPRPGGRPVGAMSASPATTEALARIRLEAQRMGSLDDDPRATERRLRAYAVSLAPEQARALVELADNRAESADARFAALQVAAWSEWGGDSEAKGAALAEFAMRPSRLVDRLGDGLAGGASPARGERAAFESILGGLATESLLDLPSEAARERLRQVATGAAEPFAVDRAERALWHLGGRAPGPEAQDRAALAGLLSH